MVNLVTRNYIHTLFLYEFGVSRNVAIAVRMALEMDQTKCSLYLDWTNTRIMQNDIPKFKTMLFENESEMKAYENWYCNGRKFGYQKHRVLNLRGSTLSNAFSLMFFGKRGCYELEASWDGIVQPENFLERRNFSDEDASYEKEMTEREFYTKLDDLFNTLTLTNKIPFEFDVK